MSKRPYPFTLVHALFKRSNIKHTSAYNPFHIRISENQGLPVLFFRFDNDFDRVSVYAIDGNINILCSFEVQSAISLVKKMLRFRLINKFHYNRFCA